MAEWSGVPVSNPAIRKLLARFPSPPGHETLPTTGASLNVTHDLYSVTIVLTE